MISTMSGLTKQVEQIKLTLKKIETNVSSVTYDEVISALNEIYTIIIAKKEREIKEIFSSLSFNTIILFLQYEEIEDKIIKILEEFIQFVSIEAIVDQYEDFINIGLTNEKENIVKLTLQELINGIEKNSQLCGVIATKFLDKIVNCFSLHVQSITKLVSKLMGEILSKNEVCLDLFLEKDSLNALQNQCNMSEVVKFTIYDLIVTISSVNDSNFEKCKKAGLFDSMINEINSKDILVKLNTIELYIKLLSNKNLYNFFEKSEIMSKLIEKLKKDPKDENSNLEDKLFLHGIIKFFASLADINMNSFIDIQNKYDLLASLENLFNEGDISSKEIVLITLGSIGSSYEGLKLIYNQKSLLNTVLDYYPSLSGNLKTVFLQNISCILTLCKLSDDVEIMTQTIYQRIQGKPNTLKELLQIGNQVFEESRISVYAVLKGIAVHNWGLKELDNSPEFIKFILDRSQESNRLGQDWKYSIIETMVIHPSSSKYVRPDTLVKFKVYLKQGPYYKYIEPKVVVKGAN
ncbi:hypothetical protein BCR36DRAFT_350751 [Piromyces finnis]|uniref:26S proteasome non-ATPase regulatory subunit 5 n=1 Tax=Piromyces finnis TaxID=1754191 RepID=A0A1Y1VBD4_9FUNG|nr:hypothetical protein BCR36DRAFT_350751 [Piromyces finnis]|eukprot:ORX51765.1 hypothetical protein BCR36DRAFT_350751 [Piromyces finnis]